MQTQYIIRKENRIFLVLPRELDKDHKPVYDVIINLDHIVYIVRETQEGFSDWSRVYITNSDRHYIPVFISIDKLKNLIKMALEDKISDYTPIISRSEILEIDPEAKNNIESEK